MPKLQPLVPGFSLMFTVGKYARPRFKRSKHAWRLTLGWFGIVAYFFDAECFWNDMSKELKKRFDREEAGQADAKGAPTIVVPRHVWDKPAEDNGLPIFTPETHPELCALVKKAREDFAAGRSSPTPEKSSVVQPAPLAAEILPDPNGGSWHMVLNWMPTDDPSSLRFVTDDEEGPTVGKVYEIREVTQRRQATIQPVHPSEIQAAAEAYEAVVELDKALSRIEPDDPNMVTLPVVELGDEGQD